MSILSEHYLPDLSVTDIQKIHDDLHRILSYLENDGKTGRKGLVTEVEDLKKELDSTKQTMVNFIAEYRKDQAVKYAKNAVWGMVGAAAVTIAWWLVKGIASVIMKLKIGM